MKAFILRHIWSIRIIWLIGAIALVFLLDSTNKNDSLILIMYIMACGTFVWFPRSFLGPEVKVSQKETEINKPLPVITEDLLDPDIIYRASVFNNLDTLKKEYEERIGSLQKELQQKRNTVIDEYFAKIQERTPEHLREKVDSNFVFTVQQDNQDKRYNFPKFFLEDYRSSFGITIWGGIKLTNAELQELNQAWHPFVAINLEYRYVVIKRPQKIQEELREHLNYLCSMQDRM